MHLKNGKILFLFIALMFVSGCSFNFPFSRVGLTKIRNQNYYLAYPSNAPFSEVDLVFLITPDGTAAEADNMMKIWQPWLVKNNLAAAVVVDWDLYTLDAILLDILRTYKFRKVFVSGFSNGGYNGCDFVFDSPDLIDGIIPMGAFCRVENLSDSTTQAKLPILAVVGEKDTWARGENFDLVEIENIELKKAGIIQEELVVPGLGHQYPVAALPQVIAWIKAH